MRVPTLHCSCRLPARLPRHHAAPVAKAHARIHTRCEGRYVVRPRPARGLPPPRSFVLAQPLKGVSDRMLTKENAAENLRESVWRLDGPDCAWGADHRGDRS